jgi:hypothetical protein
MKAGNLKTGNLNIGKLKTGSPRRGLPAFPIPVQSFSAKAAPSFRSLPLMDRRGEPADHTGLICISPV